MTEPDVASSDATNIQTLIRRDGDDYVINGRKWFISNASHPDCRVFILMGKTDPDADRHRQQSMILVPMDTPGVTVVRNISVLSHHSPEGHNEVLFQNVRVPASNLLGGEGDGFMMAQARLGPGRIHHCMRAIGMAEVCLDLMVARSQERKTFGKYLYQHGSVLEWIARSRMEIEQARLLVLKTAALIDAVGAKGARKEISMIKAVAPTLLTTVADRAMQVFGAMGISPDTPLADFYTAGRALRYADGPDEVHLQTIGRLEIKEGQDRLAQIASYLTPPT
jgi:acyl-CoA dehydrogenase